MKFLLPVLFTACFLMPGRAVHAQASIYTMDVVAWNIEFFGAPYNSGPADKDLQRENAKKIMRYFDADIYGLVEIVDTMQLRRLRDSLGSNFEYVVSPTSSNGTIGGNGWRQAQKLAFLYKKDIFTNVSTRAMLTNSSSAYTAWASGRLPFLMKADATIQGITKTFYFIVIHGKAGATNEDYNRRLAGAEELKDTLDAHFSNVNVLIIGDYNDALNRTISSGSGPESSYQPIVDDSTDADHYKSITLPLAVAGQTTMINYPNVIDNHVISNEVTPFYVLNSASVRTDVTAVVPNYVTAHNTSDHYPVFSQYSLAGIITSVPTVPVAELGIVLYPNPSQENVFFRSTRNIKNLQVRVLTMTGQTVSRFYYQQLNAGTVIQPTLPSLQKGVYLVEFQSDKMRAVVKLVR
jgi:hypothetical protein